MCSVSRIKLGSVILAIILGVLIVCNQGELHYSCYILCVSYLYVFVMASYVVSLARKSPGAQLWIVCAWSAWLARDGGHGNRQFVHGQPDSGHNTGQINVWICACNIWYG